MGGTDMYSGISKAFSLFTGNKNDTLQMLVVLSDGETTDTNLHESVIKTAKDKDIKIF